MAKKPAAKKKSIKAKPAKASKSNRPSKPSRPMKPAAKSAPKPAAGGSAVVLFTLRDSGASTLRFHSDHFDVERAKGVAIALANSPDVGDAFVVKNVEIVRPEGQV
jgi:hypothetical protein